MAIDVEAVGQGADRDLHEFRALGGLNPDLLLQPLDRVELVPDDVERAHTGLTQGGIENAPAFDERRRVIILRDCMSPVPGFEAQAEKFFGDSLAQGAHVMTAAEARAALN